MDHDTIAAAGTGGEGVTVRERDTCAQLRLPLAGAVQALRDLVAGTTTWAALASTPGVTVVTTGEDKAKAAIAPRV